MSDKLGAEFFESFGEDAEISMSGAQAPRGLKAALQGFAICGLSFFGAAGAEFSGGHGSLGIGNASVAMSSDTAATSRRATPVIGIYVVEFRRRGEAEKMPPEMAAWQDIFEGRTGGKTVGPISLFALHGGQVVDQRIGGERRRDSGTS